MASETANVTLDGGGDSDVNKMQSGTAQPDESPSEGVDGAVTMETQETTGDAANQTRDEPSSVAEPPRVITEDKEWSIAKQRLSVFVIEVYQCQLCRDFNSTQKAKVTNHLKEKHPSEWLILKDVNSAPSLTSSSKKKTITQGDLEDILEKELTERNQVRAGATRTATPKQNVTITAQDSSVESLSSKGPQKAMVSQPVFLGNNTVFLPLVPVQTPANLATKIVRLPQQKSPNTAETNPVTPAKNKRGRGRPKSRPPPTRAGGPSTRSTKSSSPAMVSGEESQEASPKKSDSVPQNSLRPGLRQKAKRKPKEFKDFVVSPPHKRHLVVEDESDEEEDEGEKERDEHEDDNDYVPQGEDKAEEQEDLPRSEQAPKPSSTVPPKKRERVAPVKDPNKFQCDKCLTCFLTMDGLNRHGKLNRCIGIPITSKEFPCTHCDYKATSAAGLKIHLHRHQQRQEKQYGCALCKRGFTSIKGVKKHRRNKCCPALKQKKHKVPKTHPCDQCDKVCKDTKALKEHMASHSEIRQYRCDRCTKAFKTYGALCRHSKKYVDGFYYCDQCSFKTKWRSSLKTHFQAHHAEDTREYLQCPKCPHQTKNKYYLKRHIELHTDSRMFICEICGKNFKTQVILNVHQETHYNGMYACSKCSYVGKTKMAIYSHQLVHVPKENMTFKCEQCSWVGKRKSELRMHYRKHSTLKIYRCNSCSKSYKHKHALTRHISEKHTRKTLELHALDVEGMPTHARTNAVLSTVQDMIVEAHLELQVTHRAQSLNGIPAYQAAQQYQLMQDSDGIEEDETDQDDEMITHQNANVSVTSVPVAQFFEIGSSDGAGRKTRIQSA